MSLKSTFCLLLIIVSFTAVSAENSAVGKILSLESRSVGAHGVFFSEAIPVISNPSCTLNDRAIIDDTNADAGAKTLISVALAAMAMDKDVVLQVDGCTIIDSDGVTTAPNISKIHFFK